MATPKRPVAITFSERNPYLDDMREQGWAYVHKSLLSGGYGEPHTDDDLASNPNPMSEVHIITW